MSENTMNIKLVKCPACGGPIDPPGGESSVRCPYCGSSVIIPENLRKKKEEVRSSQTSGMFGMSTDAMLGYGAQWSQVVQLAQQGRTEEALQKYRSFSNVSEEDARRTIDALSHSQTYDISAGYSTAYVAPLVSNYMDTAKKITAWSFGFGCLVTGFIMLITLLITGAVLWAVFSSF